MACPYSDADAQLGNITQTALSTCPFHVHVEQRERAYTDAEVKASVITVSGGTHEASSLSASLLLEIGGPDKIRIMTTRFYAHAFRDVNTKQFFFLQDGAEEHGKRLGDWIIEKMDANNKAWTDSGRFGQRQPSHYAAWNSSRRRPEVKGRHFGLKDTRIWMRLMFFAGVEVGVNKHKPFWAWWLQFIGHFIAVYERYAPRYVEDSVRWATDRRNFDEYRARGFVMSDDDTLNDGPRMVDLIAERVTRGTL